MRAAASLAALATGLLLALDPWPRLLPAPRPPAAAEPAVRETPGVHVALHVDEPLDPGRTVVWTQAFQAAWDRLEDELGARDGLRLGPPASEADWRGLHAARLREGEVARDLLAVVGGRATDDVWREVEALTGEPRPAVASREDPADVVVCARLRAGLRYQLPFPLHREPLHFGVADVPVRSYGLEEQSRGADVERVRAQARLHVPHGGDGPDVTQACVTVLTGQDGARLVLSGRPPQPTLRATWRDAAAVMAARPAEEFRWIDALWVPRVRIAVRRDYETLVGAPLRDGPPGSRIGLARQDVTLIADERGADVEATALLEAVGAMARTVAYDGPFLLALLPAGREEPCALAWIGSADGLSPWGQVDEPAAGPAEVAGLVGAWRLVGPASLEATLALRERAATGSDDPPDAADLRTMRRRLTSWFAGRRFDLGIAATGAVTVTLEAERRNVSLAQASLRRSEGGLVLDVATSGEAGARSVRWAVEREAGRLCLTHRASGEVLVLER